jgi:cytidylate kinase
MSKYNIVAIERQYASGGRTIGKQVARALGIPYYGKEILEMAAERNGQTAAYIEHLEETATNSMFYSFMAAYKASRGDTELLSPEDMLLFTETEIIKELAGEGPCVLIGRSAGCILKDRADVLRAFIYADDEARIERAVKEYGDDPDKAASLLRKFDKRRANFYNVNYNLKWEDKAGYHLCLDSGKLGLEKCAQIILDAVK